MFVLGGYVESYCLLPVITNTHISSYAFNKSISLYLQIQQPTTHATILGHLGNGCTYSRNSMSMLFLVKSFSVKKIRPK